MIKLRQRRTIVGRIAEAAKPRRGVPAADGSVPLCLGELVSWDVEGPLVTFPGNRRGPVRARAMAGAHGAQLVPGASPGGAKPGTEGVLMIDRRPGHCPILLGFLTATPPELRPAALEARLDGRRVELEANDEIVLRCGEASITLRRNGHIAIRGVQVETRAAGLNRIKGGIVNIN
jgi:hypothetical protein